MTQVQINLRRPDASGVDAPAVGRLDISPTRRRTVADSVVLPSAFTVPLVAGAALVDLAPTGPDWCWEISERVRDAATRHVAVPPDGPIGYEDLVDVDPATLDPIAEPEAAWWGALTDYRELTTTARDEAQAAAGEAGESAATAAVLAGAAGDYANLAAGQAASAANAVDSAVDARDAARVAATAADASKTAAQNAMYSASSASSTAQLHAGQAGLSASAAGESATSAAGSAGDASVSASAAAGSAASAEASAGQAAASATAAAGSAGSAAGAAASAVTAHVAAPNPHSQYVLTGPIKHLTGTGDPNGIHAAPVGSTFRNTESGGYNGARVWRKDTGAGTTGWVVEAGDTGWIDVTHTVDATRWNSVKSVTNYLRVRRTATGVSWASWLTRTLTGEGRSSASAGVMCPAITGYFLNAGYPALIVMTASPFTWLPAEFWSASSYTRALAGAGTWVAGDQVRTTASGPTSDPWPTTLTP